MNILEKIKNVIDENFGTKKLENVTLEMSITDDLHMDSLDMYEMMIEIEDEFGIVIPENEFENIDTVGDLVRIIEIELKEERNEGLAI